MDSTNDSDESFGWTDASDDSIIMKVSKEYGDDGSDSGYSYKKKIQKELFKNKEQMSSVNTTNKKKSKKRNRSDLDTSDIEDPTPKHIKTESESDLDTQSKKKSKTSICSSDLNDEKFLNMQVKDEQMSIKKKKKKRRREDSQESLHNSSFGESQSFAIDNSQSDSFANISEISQDDNHVNLKEEPRDTENYKTKKKKLKKKKGVLDNISIEDKFSADKTMVEERIPNYHNSYSVIVDKSNGDSEHSLNSDGINEHLLTDTEQNCDLENSSNSTSNQVNKSKKKKKKNEIPHSEANNDEIPHSEANNDEILSSSNNLSQRVTKIAARIKFEEDSFDLSQVEAEKNSLKDSVQLKNYLKINTHLSPISPTQLSGNVITEDDEVWILKCPSEIDIKNLKDTSLVIDNKCKLKSGSQTYVGVIDNSANRVDVATINHDMPVVKNIPLLGTVHFRKRIPKAHYVEHNNIVNNQTNFIPLPDTKYRHPLFGVNYKSAIKIPKHIEKRLNGIEPESIPDDNGKRKKKKHKKEKNLSENEQEIKSETSVRKNRKRKHSYYSETAPKSAKKSKHDPDSAETWESEKGIEQQLFSF